MQETKCPICGSEWDGIGICPDCELDRALMEVAAGAYQDN
jgi:hypothetical protein